MLPPELDENEELDADADADADDLPLAVAIAQALDEELVGPAIAALPPIVKINKRQATSSQSSSWLFPLFEHSQNDLVEVKHPH